MDYEKKYKKALERANEYHFDGAKQCIIDTLEYIFPELVESEDERIRKAILNYFIKCWGNCKDDVYGIHVEDVIAWLEKQGRQKSMDDLTPQEAMDIAVAKCFHEQKPVDKIKPKFKVGNWITNGACTIQITSVDDRYYWHDNDCVGGDIESMDKKYHLWTIQDAKDGDILQF